MKTFFISLLSFITALSLSDSSAAQQPPSFEDRVLSELPHQLDPSFITFALENDLFGRGTDQHYTSGFRLSWFEAGAVPPDWIGDIGELYPGFRVNDTTSVTFSVGQNLYTPEDITIAAAQPEDRPWAAWLYTSAGLTTVTDNHVDELEMALGVVGPWAQGEETQRFVHDLFIGDDPEGWDNQLDNEVAGYVSWQRRWPRFMATPLHDDIWLTTTPSAGVTLGTVYTHAEGGVNFRLSPRSELFSDTPLRVRPAMPGTGYYPLPQKGWSWSVFGGANARLVGRNIFLDGNTFEDSPSVDKRRFVYDLNVGFDVTYGQNRLSYTLVRRSKEFHGQNDPAVFGAFSISRRF